MIIPKDTCTPVFIAALFTIARTWKQPKYPSTEERIEDVVYIYNGILLSHKKEWNCAFCRDMDGPRVHHTEWVKSERKKQIPYMNTYHTLLLFSPLPVRQNFLRSRKGWIITHCVWRGLNPGSGYNFILKMTYSAPTVDSLIFLGGILSRGRHMWSISLHSHQWNNILWWCFGKGV